MKRRRKFTLNAVETGAAFAGTGCSAIGKLTSPNTTSTPPPPGTAFTAGPGLTLTNVHVQLIFWGAWWNGNPLAGQVNNAVVNLLAGPYMSYLAQYGIHRGNVKGVTFAGDSEPGNFAFTNVTGLVNSLLDQDRLPEPDDQWPIVYAVIMPVNSSFSGGATVIGQNAKFTWNDYDIGDVDNDPAYTLWTGNDGTLDYITTVLSHELAEIASDPNGGDGITQIGCTGSSCQIGDVGTVCQNWCDYVRGVKAQAYWSQLDGNGVLPTMYSVRRTLFGKSIGGKIPRPMPSMNAWITSQF